MSRTIEKLCEDYENFLTDEDRVFIKDLLSLSPKLDKDHLLLATTGMFQVLGFDIKVATKKELKFIYETFVKMHFKIRYCKKGGGK